MVSPQKPFQMHQVLNYRKELERLCKLDFATAKRNLDDAHEVLEQNLRATMRLAAEFSGGQHTFTSVTELQMYSHFFDRQRYEQERQRLLIAELDYQLEQQREKLQEATKEKKVMEQLKIKQDAAFRKELAHKEALLLDEIAVQKQDRGETR